MAIKKTNGKKVEETKKKLVKNASSPVKKLDKPLVKIKTANKVNPTVVVKENLVEKKLSSVMDSSYGENKNSSVSQPINTVKKSKKGSAWWGLLTLVLLVIFAGILLYEYNNDFRANLNKLANSTGIVKLDSYGVNNEAVQPKEKVTLKLTIVYDQADPNQKTTIEKYISNIEKNLENTKTETSWIDKNDAQGQALISKTNAKFLPLFITDETIKKHPQYALFAPAVKDINGVLLFQSEGMEYLQIPGIDGARVRGGDPSKAKVTIIEYASLTCEYCKLMQTILNKVAEKYKGQVVIVSKHFDRGGIDSLLAQSSECAGEEGKFDKIMDVYYEKQSEMFSAIQASKDQTKEVENQIKLMAKAAGANGDKVLACAKSGKYADLIKKQTEEGQEYGVIGTPSMFINKTFLGGALPEADFIKMIDSELQK